MKGSQSHTCHKLAIPSIKIVVQMWYGYHIQDAMATQRGKSILKETPLDEFLTMGHHSPKLKNSKLSTEH